MQILGTSRGEREGQRAIFLVVGALVAVGVILGFFGAALVF